MTSATALAPIKSSFRWESTSVTESSLMKRKREDHHVEREVVHRGYQLSRSGSRSGNADHVEVRGMSSMNSRKEKIDHYGAGRGSRDVPAEERWRCPECRGSNDSHQEFCTNCGPKFRRDNDRRFRNIPLPQRRRSFSESSVCSNSSSFRERHDRHRRHSRHYERPDRDRDKDYYGPASFSRERRSEARHDPRPTKAPLKCEWPPQFESDGASYIFDSRSGFFYEASSDFFYDPKTKLYYGNKKQAYFQYCPGEDPPFRAVSQQQNTSAQQLDSGTPDQKAGNSSALTPEQQQPAQPKDETPLAKPTCTNSASKSSCTGSSGFISTTTHGVGKSCKKKIAICLKKKKLGTNNTPKKVESSITSPAQKKREDDIQKWSQRGREMRQESNADTSPSDPSIRGSTANSASNNTNHNSSTQQSQEVKAIAEPAVSKTTSGQPVCLLCKRKFGDMEKLKQHVQFSALHKQNLAKKVAADAKKAADDAKKAADDAKKVATDAIKHPNTPEYRDRAKERRVMYGGPGPVSKSDPSAQIMPSLTKARAVETTEIIRPDQRLGDRNIGNQMLQKLGWKKGESCGQEKNGINGKLKEDWAAIEALADNNAKRSATRGNGFSAP